MLKYLSLLIAFTIATIVMYIILIATVIAMVLRGLFWDFKFQWSKHFTLDDANFLALPRDIWEDFHGWYYKKESNGC